MSSRAWCIITPPLSEYPRWDLYKSAWWHHPLLRRDIIMCSYYCQQQSTIAILNLLRKRVHSLQHSFHFNFQHLLGEMLLPSPVSCSYHFACPSHPWSCKPGQQSLQDRHWPLQCPWEAQWLWARRWRLECVQENHSHTRFESTSRILSLTSSHSTFCLYPTFRF